MKFSLFHLRQNRLGKGFLRYSRKETCLFRLKKQSLISRNIEILQKNLKKLKIKIVLFVYLRQNRSRKLVLRYSRKEKWPFWTVEKQEVEKVEKLGCLSMVLDKNLKFFHSSISKQNRSGK